MVERYASYPRMCPTTPRRRRCVQTNKTTTTTVVELVWYSEHTTLRRVLDDDINSIKSCTINFKYNIIRKNTHTHTHTHAQTHIISKQFLLQ